MKQDHFIVGPGALMRQGTGVFEAARVLCALVSAAAVSGSALQARFSEHPGTSAPSRRPAARSRRIGRGQERRFIRRAG